MSRRQLIGASILAALVFVYSMFVMKDLLVGFIIGTGILNVTLGYTVLDNSGSLPDIEEWVSNPWALGSARLTGGLVGGSVIIVYADWLAQDLAAGIVALGLFWLLLILTVDPTRSVAPD